MDVFLQFYTFDNDVRIDYPYIEAVIIFLSTIEGSFPLTVKEIVSRSELLQLYQEKEELFKEIYRCYCRAQSVLKLRRQMITALETITGEDESGNLTELMEFERKVAAYKRSDHKEPVLITTGFDITAYMKTGEFVKEKTNVLVSLDEETYDIRLKKIPSWISFDE